MVVNATDKSLRLGMVVIAFVTMVNILVTTSFTLFSGKADKEFVVALANKVDAKADAGSMNTQLKAMNTVLASKVSTREMEDVKRWLQRISTKMDALLLRMRTSSVFKGEVR